MTDVANRSPLAFSRRALQRRNTPAAPERSVADDRGSSVPDDTPGAPPAQRSISALRKVSPQQAAAGGLYILAALFLVSLLFPFRFHLFGLLFQPYKLWLTIILIPLAVMLLMGKAGKPMIVDWLMIGATVWALLSLLKNHGVGFTVITGGTHVLEFLGAYLLARIAIRSGADFRRMAILLFVMVLILLPLAAIESLTRVPFLAEFIGPGWMPVHTGIRMNMRRAQTVFEHPILFGAFVSTMFGLAWYVVLPHASAFTRTIFASIVGVTTIFTLSTGAFLAVQVQIVLILWEIVMRPYPNRWRVFFWLVVITYIVLDQVTTRSPFHSLVHYAAFSSGSSYNRILIFDHGMANVRANPIFGLGFRDWARPSWMNPSFDNFWLLNAMRHGVPMFLMFAGAIVLIIVRSGRQTMLDPLDRACRAGYLTALGGIIIAGGTVHYWKQLLVFVMFFVGSGVWMFTGGARSPARNEALSSTAEDGPRSGHGRAPVTARGTHPHPRRLGRQSQPG